MRNEISEENDRMLWQRFRAETDPCPPIATLAAYADGDEIARWHWQKHVKHCEVCQFSIAEIDEPVELELPDTLRHRVLGNVKTKGRSRMVSMFVAAAAAVLAAWVGFQIGGMTYEMRQHSDETLADAVTLGADDWSEVSVPMTEVAGVER